MGVQFFCRCVAVVFALAPSMRLCGKCQVSSANHSLHPFLLLMRPLVGDFDVHRLNLVGNTLPLCLPAVFSAELVN